MPLNVVGLQENVVGEVDNDPHCEFVDDRGIDRRRGGKLHAGKAAGRRARECS